MVTFCSLPVARSRAATLRMPLASMSNVTSTCGTPRGAGGIPSSRKRPRVMLSLAIGLSPCRTWISTAVWPSAAVEKTSLFLIGILVLRPMSVVITSPSVSTPSESGVTSTRRMSLTSPPRTPPCMAQDGLEGAAHAPHQVLGDLLELGACQLHLQVLRAGGVGGDEGQVDLRLGHRGKLDLAFLAGLAQALQCLAVLPQVDPALLLVLVGRPVDDALVPVVAAQVGVAVGGLDLGYAFAHLEQADVERPAAQVEDEDGFVFFLVEPIRH